MTYTQYYQQGLINEAEFRRLAFREWLRWNFRNYIKYLVDEIM